ncbi:MAG: hypothetical protein QNJ15_07310 [Erythrobacter sp.]|nr:hypothetical protein [Erythrobacter sp.]
MLPTRWRTYLELSLTLTDEQAGVLNVIGQTIELDDARFDRTEVSVALVGPWDTVPRIVLRPNGEGLEGYWQEGEARFPMILRRVASPVRAANRVEAWLQDIEIFETRFLDFDKSFSPGQRQQFLERTATIREELASLSDPEIVVGLSRAASSAENAHTRLHLLRRNTVWSRLPIRVWWFNDGLRIISTDDDSAALLGCRVDAISGVDARLARDAVGSVLAATPSWLDYVSTYFLTSAEALQGLGLASPDEAIEFQFSHCDAPPQAVFEPSPVQFSDQSTEAWWWLSPNSRRVDGWQQALQSIGSPIPLYLRHPDENYWHEWIDDREILYVKLSRTEPMAERPLDQYAERLREEIRAGETRALIVDLRFNTGGNGGLVENLMKMLEEETRGLSRFVITGRATFSAGILVAARWKEAGNVTIVGEPVGDRIDYWAEGGNIRLPNSNLVAHFSNGAHHYSRGPCPTDDYCLDINIEGLGPDTPVFLSWADYISGQDPALEAILARLVSSESALEK